MNNIQCIRQTGQQSDIRHPFNSNIFCRSDESSIISGLCLSDKFDEHGTDIHIQRQNSLSIIGTSTGQFIRKILQTKFHTNRNHNNNYNYDNTDWLMIFTSSKARLFCRRSKLFDLNRYPSLEQWIIVLNCHCSNLIDFYFDEPQANQFMCDYLDALSLKGISYSFINNKPLFLFLLQQHPLKIVIHQCLLDIYLHVNMSYVYPHLYVY
jgi:hypothetical protein